LVLFVRDQEHTAVNASATSSWRDIKGGALG
jgi:hypothetical protein